MRSFRYYGALSSTLVALAPACGDDPPCSDLGACATTSAGSDAAAPDAESAPKDGCLDNPSAPECLKEDEAFFVSNTKGDDVAGLGTKGKPFKKLGTVLGKLTDKKKRVYICEGT